MQHRFISTAAGFKRRSLMLVASIATTAVTLACGGTAAPATPTDTTPIKVGTIMSLTGPLAVFGVPEKQAIQLAFDQVNAAGGINGHKTSVTIYDAAGDTAQGTTLTRKLLEEDNVKLIVGGGASSGVALAMQKLLTPKSIFFATGEADPTLSNPVDGNPTTFQTTVTSDTVVSSLLAYASKNGAKKIAILGDTGAFGQSGVTSAKNLASKYNVTVVSQDYAATSTDLTPQLKQLQAQNPDAYIIWTASPSGVIAIKNAAALGLKGLVMTSHAYGNPAFMTQAGDAAKILTVPVVNATVYSQAAAQLPAAQKTELLNFATAYKAAYNQEISIYAAEAYDAAQIAIRALKATKGNTDGKKMAAALEAGGNFQGVMGTFHFSKTDHYGLLPSDVKMAKWDGTNWVLQSS